MRTAQHLFPEESAPILLDLPGGWARLIMAQIRRE